jgi:hypothetical protein
MHVLTIKHAGRQERITVTGADSTQALRAALHGAPLSAPAAHLLAQLALMGGTGTVEGVTVSGYATDGAHVDCPHCGHHTPLGRVRTNAEFQQWCSARNGGFIDPRDLGRFKRGVPLYWPVSQCELCEEQVTEAHVTYPAALAGALD